MKLQEYYQKNFATQEEFAKFLGVDQSLVSRWFKGKRSPSKEKALLIVSKTKGAVSLIEAITTDYYHAKEYYKKRVLGVLND